MIPGHPIKRFSPFFHPKSLLTFRLFCMCMHTHSSSPPPTQATTALQIPLALPPHTSWPCATTTAPPSINSKSIFCGKPCQNRHAFEIFRFFVHWACTHTTCTTCPLCHHLGQLLACLFAPLCTLACPHSTFCPPPPHPSPPFHTPSSRL